MTDFAQYQEKVKLEGHAREIKKRIRLSDDVILKDELKSMKRVLRRLGMYLLSSCFTSSTTTNTRRLFDKQQCG